jgi:signal transduction histidine kinase
LDCRISCGKVTKFFQRHKYCILFVEIYFCFTGSFYSSRKGESYIYKVPNSLNKIKASSQTASFPYLVLAVSLLLTIGITYNFYQSAKNKDKIRFNNEISRLQSAIENKINLYIALLKGGRGFIESNQNITRRNFAEYVESLEMRKNYTGAQGIGYTQIVPAAERNAFIEKMKAEGYADFNIFPFSEKADYKVVTYLEPFDERNRKFIGFDISTEKNWMDASSRAAASGSAAASAKISLMQEDGVEAQPGFLIYLPIYKKGSTTSDEDRKKNVTSYIYSPFRADRFLNEIQNNQSASDIFIKVYDGEANEENLLMQTGGDRAPLKIADRIDEQYAAEKELNVTGKNWIVRFESSPAFTAQSSVSWTPIILVIGVIFSLLLSGMTYWETFARIRLQTTAADLYELQEQKQELLEKEQKARLSAEQANKAKDAFIAVVSHELRTPLNTISGWTRILKTDELSENTKNLALEKVEKNLRLQTKLVESLLDYSQIVSGTVAIQGEEFDFSHVFEKIFAEVEPTAQEKSVEMVKENRLNGQTVFGDEAKIELVIYNLLNNAVKFTHSGGKVEAVALENNGHIQMTIKDNGRGISAEFLPYVFDRFTQADTSSTRDSGGLGLGLTISNQIVKLHNGTIEAQSEGEGKGAIFTVKVPRYVKSVR